MLRVWEGRSADGRRNHQSLGEDKARGWEAFALPASRGSGYATMRHICGLPTMRRIEKHRSVANQAGGALADRS
jgi:hypothetical protein